jgi:hypothetical protein
LQSFFAPLSSQTASAAESNFDFSPTRFFVTPLFVRRLLHIVTMAPEASSQRNDIQGIFRNDGGVLFAGAHISAGSGTINIFGGRSGQLQQVIALHDESEREGGGAASLLESAGACILCLGESPALFLAYWTNDVKLCAPIVSACGNFFHRWRRRPSPCRTIRFTKSWGASECGAAKGRDSASEAVGAL